MYNNWVLSCKSMKCIDVKSIFDKLKFSELVILIQTHFQRDGYLNKIIFTCELITFSCIINISSKRNYFQLQIISLKEHLI